MKRTMQIEDLFSLQFLQGGEFSPDGAGIAYSISYVDDDKECSALYLPRISV